MLRDAYFTTFCISFTVLKDTVRLDLEDKFEMPDNKTLDVYFLFTNVCQVCILLNCSVIMGKWANPILMMNVKFKPNISLSLNTTNRPVSLPKHHQNNIKTRLDHAIFKTIP